ncbi:GNAT family N-acetyltransferase [Sporosarcina sp. FSL K6-1522]|uniref:GNAT family N-acetyltransferase n=1 Tax=Sporosarcina sp. FSL K6-1522 TaxID=2921554 RepID=UPI00315A347A
MAIQYSFELEYITKEALEHLFLSLEWESGNFPDQLYEAIINSHSVVTAWDGDQLVGLANALSDGVMTAYFHYVLTNPVYQGQGIGKVMMEMMLDKYQDYYTKVLISYPKAIDFYKRLGFEGEDDSLPMYTYTKQV